MRERAGAPSKIILCAPFAWTAAELRAHLSSDPLRLVSESPSETLLFTPDHVFDADLRDGADARIEKAFRASAPRAQSFREEDFLTLRAHRSTLYVLSDGIRQDDAAEIAHGMMHLGVSLLDKDALALKCDSAGIAHAGERFRALVVESDAAMRALAKKDKTKDEAIAARYRFWRALFETFVRGPIADGEDFYTCGMHLLGRRDAIVARSCFDHRVGDAVAEGSDVVAAGRAHALMEAFLLYVLAECGDDAPRAGHTFRRTDDEPRWTIAIEPCARYPEDDFFHNPAGYFRLTR